MTKTSTIRDDGLYAELIRRGVSRRSFLKLSAAMAAALALPASYAPRIASALAAAPRLPVIWLRAQECGGDTRQFLQATDPTTSQLILDVLSIDYHETLMAAAGSASDTSLAETLAAYPDGYVLIVEGSVPTVQDGTWCMVGGRPMKDVVRQVGENALATIAVGTCALDGGIQAAGGGTSGAVGAGSVVSGSPVINLPNCPVNVENLTATIVHYLTFKEWPPVDGLGRPYFAYGGLIHNQCERRAHFEFGEFVQAWGDEGAQKGWCLYKMGCKGPETYANCPTERYADGTSWPIKAGTGCIGCSMPGFWDSMSPFYRRLSLPIPPLPAPAAVVNTMSVDDVGVVIVGGIAAVAAVHGTIMTVRETRIRSKEKKHIKAAAAERDARRAAEAAAAVPAAVAVATPPAAPAAPAATMPPAVDEAPAQAVATPPAAPAAPVPPVPADAAQPAPPSSTPEEP